MKELECIRGQNWSEEDDTGEAGVLSKVEVISPDMGG
jgi:hypothetical protein